MKKILITGATGFAGKYLAEYKLSLKNAEVFGTSLFSDKNIETESGTIQILQVDLLNATQTAELVRNSNPDEIYHLAALTSPRESFDNPANVFTNNVTAEINLLEAVKKNNLTNTKILIVSSAEIYGKVKKEDLPIDEATPLNPSSPYAVSKIAQDYLGLQYFLSYDLLIVRVRPFNHIGPRQSAQFVVGAFAKQIADIEKRGKEPILQVGNLESRRDFTDVRDMVKAYSVALALGEVGEVYNIGSGVSHKIWDILKALLSFSSVKNIRVEKNVDRPSDNPDLVCDAKKFKTQTGWSPKIPLDQTLKETLDYWRNIS